MERMDGPEQSADAAPAQRHIVDQFRIKLWVAMAALIPIAGGIAISLRGDNEEKKELHHARQLMQKATDGQHDYPEFVAANDILRKRNKGPDAIGVPVEKFRELEQRVMQERMQYLRAEQRRMEKKKAL